MKIEGDLPIPEPLPTDYRFINVTGKKFGNLKVRYYAGRYRDKESQWLCLCDCGEHTLVTISSLKYLKTTSCGNCKRSTKFRDENNCTSLKKPETIICEDCKKEFPFT